jgi:alpha-galactosidase
MDFDVLEWISNLFSLKSDIPFSFKCRGVKFANLCRNFEVRKGEPVIENDVTHMDFTYSDAKTGLELKYILRFFSQIGAVDIILHVSNPQTRNSPLLQDIQVFDSVLHPFLPNGTEFVLHHNRGSFAAKEDYEPFDRSLNTNEKVRFSPKKGRSSNTFIFPFFNVETRGAGGVIIAVGWSGQWASTIVKDKSGRVRFKIGMERTKLFLAPGESIQTPRVLFFPWRSPVPMDGHNAFRRFFLQYYAPRRNGKLVQLPLACYGVRNWGKRTNEANFFTEENQKEYADWMAPFGIEVFWIDAGWFEGGWPNGVGSWIIRKDGFPNGLRPISDYVKQYNMKMLIWFEPERVREGTWLAINHPEWCLTIPFNPNRLLDLGNPEAREWLIDHLAKMIENEGICIFRLDFNQDPLPFWKRADARGRQGIHEIRHIEGLYAMWDELQRRFPGIIFDNCASGGRRLDLETMTRCIALTRSDYAYYEPNGAQSHTWAISHYLPTASTFTNEPSPYKIRSSMTNGIMLDWNPFTPDFNSEQAQLVLDEFRQVRSLFLADFYPLTPYSIADSTWCIYQFHDPVEDRGMVLAFRRHEAVESVMSVALMALDNTHLYRVEQSNENLEKSESQMSGNELSNKMTFSIPTKPGSILMKYRIVRS